MAQEQMNTEKPAEEKNTGTNDIAGDADYIVGVDAGGTYTDAVILDSRNGSIVGFAKSPTTHYAPGVGIAASVGQALQIARIDPARVRSCALSTTLATNALLEGKGVDVGLIIIGFNKMMHLPAAAARYVPGGHNQNGTEVEPLGIPFLIDHLKELYGKVDAFAVCSLNGYVNPTHELVAAQAIGLTCNVPVFCSHEASMHAGMQERATTALLNAQLLPVMQDFLAGVRAALNELGIHGEIFVVRGDASSMPMQEAERHASATVASGPAATACFGAYSAKQYGAEKNNAAEPKNVSSTDLRGTLAHKTDLQDALVVDVGGTTTDMTLIRNGEPVLDGNGMVIGAWETHVDAVEMFTVAVGGDSLISVSAAGDGTIQLGPSRALPLSMAEARGCTLPPLQEWLGAEHNGRCICLAQTAQNTAGSENDVNRANKVDDTATKNLNPNDPRAALARHSAALLAYLREHGSAPLATIMHDLHLSERSAEEAAHRLARRQSIMVCGFTPTDALHVLGQLNLGNSEHAAQTATEIATEAARILGALCGLSAQAFAELVLEKAATLIEEAILQHVGRREVSSELVSFLTRQRQYDAAHSEAAGQAGGQAGTQQNDADNGTGASVETQQSGVSLNAQTGAQLGAQANAQSEHTSTASRAAAPQKSLLRIQVALDVPLIGIGAASRYLLPRVAARLKTRALFLPRHEVGNAVGAALLALHKK